MNEEVPVLVDLRVRIACGGELRRIVQLDSQKRHAISPFLAHDRLLLLSERVVWARACEDLGDCIVVHSWRHLQLL